MNTTKLFNLIPAPKCNSKKPHWHDNSLSSFISPSWPLTLADPQTIFHPLLKVIFFVVVVDLCLIQPVSPQYFLLIQPITLFMEQHWQFPCSFSEPVERKQGEGLGDSVYKVYKSVQYCPNTSHSLTTHFPTYSKQPPVLQTLFTNSVLIQLCHFFIFYIIFLL